VTLDDARAERALGLLHDISADFQVIYLTTSDRYDKAADKVALLEPATAVTPDGPPDDLERPAEPAAMRRPDEAAEPSAEVAAEPV
jgi:hypothetical protein